MRVLISAIAATLLGAGVLTTSVLASTTAPTANATEMATAKTDHGRGFDRLNDVLTALVQKGVISEAQKTAILEAVKDAAGHGDRDAIRRFVGDVVQASATYLGVPVERIKGELKAGKSLGQIADQVPGKSRDGLVADLDAKADARIAQAVADGKLTQDQAAKLTPKVHQAIATLVDRSRPTPVTTLPAN